MEIDETCMRYDPFGGNGMTQLSHGLIVFVTACTPYMIIYASPDNVRQLI